MFSNYRAFFRLGRGAGRGVLEKIYMPRALVKLKRKPELNITGKTAYMKLFPSRLER